MRERERERIIRKGLYVHHLRVTLGPLHEIREIDLQNKKMELGTYAVGTISSSGLYFPWEHTQLGPLHHQDYIFLSIILDKIEKEEKT